MFIDSIYMWAKCLWKSNFTPPIEERGEDENTKPLFVCTVDRWKKYRSSRWFHSAFTCDGEKIRVFRNGVLIATSLL